MPVTIRPAKASDEPALGRMGAALARQHHGFDPQRFMVPDDVEAGYRWWLSKEARRPQEAVVLVAELDGDVVGYCYGRLEGVDWNMLLDKHGALHDIWVEDKARGTGTGRLLAEAMVQRLTELGAPRVVLSTAAKNEAARRLFERLGWRATMIEMTRETPPRA